MGETRKRGGERAEEGSANPSRAPRFSDLVEARLSRRGFLGGASLFAATAAIGGLGSGSAAAQTSAPSPSSLSFQEIGHTVEEGHAVPDGYDAQVLIRWGDKVQPDAPPFDPANQTAEAQSKQFGYNNDYIGYLPLPLGSTNSERGLLVVNHETAVQRLMFPGSPSAKDMTREQTDVDIVAHGLSVIEVVKENGRWRVVEGSAYARRLTPYTEGEITGPAAGTPRLFTALSPNGRRTLGTYNNCAGGTTPWGTVLSGEENIQNHFSGDPANSPEAASYKRFGLAAGNNTRYAWGRYHDRWNVEKEPNEPNHVGWVIEFDPYDPNAKILKRTALGRCRHEGANVVVGADGTVVAYTGDDQADEYIYRFISAKKHDPNDRAHNLTLLEEGTLSVARFNDDHTLTWLPLAWGEGPLTAANGFSSQADVLIDARRAADLVGATPMDRPEDIEVNPVSKLVYATLTKNGGRTAFKIDAANPRHSNHAGHIIEFGPADGNHAAPTFRWSILFLAGNPKDKFHGAIYHKAVSENGWLACPDNIAFDSKGRLWIGTDGADDFDIAEGVWACDVTGPGRALTKRFMRVPRGAELCGPVFTPDDRTFFCAAQHPADDDPKSTYDNPSTRWPDFQDWMPPRPSVIVVTKKDGGVIGS